MGKPACRASRLAGLCLVVALSPLLMASSRGLQVTLDAPDGKQLPLYKASYALVVGNGRYRGGWDPLEGAPKDAQEVAAALEGQGFTVRLETDLTRERFDRIFGEFVLSHGAEEDNRLLFYYAGHGYTQKMATGEDLGSLVMVEAPSPAKDPLGFRLASVDVQSLVTQAKIIRAKHVLFMFDSCFSGSILNLREQVTPQSVTESVRHPVRQFITAGRANEPVPDHSAFKQAFLDLLEGRDREPIPDGYLTGEELGLYLKTKVPEYNPDQHPQYGKIRDPKLDKGDFIFALRPAAGAARAREESETLRSVVPMPDQERVGIPVEPSLLLEKVKPSVVSVIATHAKAGAQPERLFGSGFVVASEGFVVTDHLIVKDAQTVSVSLPGPESMSAARLVGHDDATNLALLRIEGLGPLPFLALGDSGSLKIGQVVMAVGRAPGLAYTVHTGTVTMLDEQTKDVIQTDVAINPANSGGPLLDTQGRIVGVNMHVAPQTAGIGFAIPANTAAEVIRHLRSWGKVRRGYLGITLQDRDERTGAPGGGGVSTGVVVLRVEKGSPAERGGLRANDVLQAVNGETIVSSADLANRIKHFPPGSGVRLSVWREGATQELLVTLGERGP